jgi:hypothetical protein
VPCSSSEELLAHVSKFAGLSKNTRKGKIFVQRIKDLCDRLTPYFSIIETICGSNPQWANIAWGAFRLVLQVRLKKQPDQTGFLADGIDNIQLASIMRRFREAM